MAHPRRQFQTELYDEKSNCILEEGVNWNDDDDEKNANDRANANEEHDFDSPATVIAAQPVNDDFEIKAEEEAENSIDPYDEELAWHMRESAFAAEDANEYASEVPEKDEEYDSDATEIDTQAAISELQPTEPTVNGASASGRGTTRRSISRRIKNYQCPQCDKRFDCPSSLNRHQVIHLGTKEHTCPVCAKTFSMKGNLEQHMLVHSGLKKHRCNQCSKSFSQKSNLKAHQLLHAGVKEHTCHICAKSFTMKHHLSQHLLMHTGLSRKHPCLECSKTFSTEAALSRHQVYFHIGYDSVTQSPEPDLNAQQSLSLGPTTPVTLPLILPRGTTLLLLPLAQPAPTPVAPVAPEEPPVAAGPGPKKHWNKTHYCRFCSSSFSHQRSLKQHLLKFHKSAKFEMVNGQIVFKSVPKTLPKQVENTQQKDETVPPVPPPPLGDKPYLCETCNQSFAQLTNLVRHRTLLHTGIMEYQCQVCSKQFTTNDTLERHLETVHLRTKAHSCHLCSKTFNKKVHLQYHLKQQHYAKPKFKCSHCERVFIRKDTLQYHLDTKHKQ